MSTDLQEHIDGVRHHMSRLLDEVERLNEENERLRRENKALREEVTLVRIFKNMSEREEEFPIDDPASIPSEVFALFRRLPGTFKFIDFFQLAERYGLGEATARDSLLYFLRQGMLQQKGARIEKAERPPRSPSSGRRPPIEW